MAAWRIRRALLVIFIVIFFVFIISLIIGLSGKPTGEKIAVVEIDGLISNPKETMEDIVRFKEDTSIRGVIIRVNSPGGAVGPTQEIFREIQKLRDVKKVYASMASVCASGGYYIASAGERIYANPSTITGSIGVIMEQAVVEELMKKIGIQSNTIKAGDMKDAGTPFRKMTDQERLYLTTILKDVHDQFIRDIAASRKMNIEVATKLSDGRIYTGLQAKNLGLVDNIGNFYDTVDDLKKALKIKGKPVLVYGKKKTSFFKMLSSSLAQELTSRYFSEPIRYQYNP